MNNLREFVQREIAAIRSIDETALPRNIETTTNFVMQSVLTHDIENLMMLFYVFWPYLRTYTLQFCHELFTYASSSYNVISYDRSVRYYTSDPPQIISVK